MPPTDREVQVRQTPISPKDQNPSEFILHELNEALNVLRESHELVRDINEDLFGSLPDESPEVVGNHQGSSGFFPQATDRVMDIKRWSTRLRQILRDLEENL